MDSRVAVFFTYQLDAVRGADRNARREYEYALRNDLVTRIDMQGVNNPRIRASWASQSFDRYYSDALNTYVFQMSGPLLTIIQREVRSSAAVPIRVSMRLSYERFLRETLYMMTRSAGDTDNLATSERQDYLLEMASVRGSGSGTRFALQSRQTDLEHVPAEIHAMRAPDIGESVEYVLHVRFKFDQLDTEDRREARRVLSAADWTKLRQHGQNRLQHNWFNTAGLTPSDATERKVITWERNLWHYLINYLPLSRGEQIFDSIKSRVLQNPPPNAESLVGAVRNEVDRHLISANHWADRRETGPGEQRAHTLSEIYGSIHADAPRASPVEMLHMLRSIDLHPQQRLRQPHRWPHFAVMAANTAQPAHDLNDRTRVAAYMSLQIGLGHCQEHADICFTLLADLSSEVSFGNELTPVVLSGNANIDHAFVIAGLPPGQLLRAPSNRLSRGRSEVGEVTCFDLEAALDRAGGRAGFVCDAYLESRRQHLTARDLLRSIENRRRRLSTRYVRYQWRIHPAPATLPDPIDVDSLPNI